MTKACYNGGIMYENAKRKYAVVDLEATSAGSNAAIIQVGIVIIEND